MYTILIVIYTNNEHTTPSKYTNIEAKEDLNKTNKKINTQQFFLCNVEFYIFA